MAPMRSASREIFIEGRPFIEFREKDDNGRMRIYNRCAHICQTGMYAGQMCTWKARSDSTAITRQKGTHKHQYTIDVFARRAVGCPSAELQTKFARFIARANISLRAGSSTEAIEFINEVIQYGYGLGRQKSGNLASTDLWNVGSRKGLRDIIIDTSDRILRTGLVEFKSMEVNLVVDGATINHVETLDFILIAHGYRNVCKSLLFKTVEMKSCTSDDYRLAVLTVMKELDDKGVTLCAITADGLASQRAAIDEQRPSSFQHDIDIPSFARNVVYVYCRCHLLNLVIKDWLDTSLTAQKCHDYLRRLAVRLRRKDARTSIGRICPESIDTRFCYDFRLVTFIIRNAEKIAKLDAQISVPLLILQYGAILEVLWHLMGRFERRNATLADTFEDILYALTRLDTMAEETLQPGDHFLAHNAKVVSVLIRMRFKEQYDLSCLAFSLTKRGRQFFRNRAGIDEPLTDEEHYDPWVWIHLRFATDDDRGHLQEIEDMDYDGDEEEEEELDEEEDLEVVELYGDDIVYVDQFDRENNQAMKRLQDKGAYSFGDHDIMRAAEDFFRKRDTGPGHIDDIASKLFTQFEAWMNMPPSDVPERAANAFDYWQGLMYSPEMKPFATIARSLVSIPCAEVANERCFSIKRRIVGRNAVRTSPELLTARTRIALANPQENH